jgi:hypothetical protein
VEVPPIKAGFMRQWRAFAGPAILVSVGYMDPGNWGTDLAGGAIQIWPAVGGGARQFNGDFFAAHRGPPGRGYR